MAEIPEVIEIQKATEEKHWYESKTIWAAIMVTLLGLAQMISGMIGNPVEVPKWAVEILIGYSIYALRTAKTDIK